MQTKCWYCDFFKSAGAGAAGNCRRRAPRAIDFQSTPFPSTQYGNRVFPYIPDGTIEWCGDYKPARGDVPSPPA